MPLVKEDIDFIKAQFEAWLTEMLPEQKPGVYDLELRGGRRAQASAGTDAARLCHDGKAVRAGG